MTNIWTQSFEDIRKPFFEMEDPYTINEKKEKEDKPKRWWDDDGDGIGYEKGEVSGKFKKKVKKEEVESLDEISLKTKMSAFKKRATHDFESDSDSDNYTKSGENKTDKIKANIVKKHGEKAGAHAERAAHAGIFGRRSFSMPKKPTNEEVESLVEVDKKINKKEKSNEEMVDVMSGKNTVTIGPKIAEEVEAWVSELVKEGYDLSQFTWDEMNEIYESAELDEGTAGMPARGDAQTVDATDTQIASAKRRAAQAQIRADMARIQLQKASTTKESLDSVVQYLSNRSDIFENLEEGVFDPKKSKMRPASERSQRTITATQRSAAKKEAQRTSEIHSKGETVLAGMRSSGKRGKVQTTPPTKPAAPTANRKVKGRYDKLAQAASKVLKDIKK